jgi:hypothetical protein
MIQNVYDKLDVAHLESLCQAMNGQNTVVEITTSALKFLQVSLKLLLYLPQLNSRIDIFERMFRNWSSILEKRVKNDLD